MKFNETVDIKSLAQYLTHRKCLIKINDYSLLPYHQHLAQSLVHSQPSVNIVSELNDIFYLWLAPNFV